LCENSANFLIVPALSKGKWRISLRFQITLPIFEKSLLYRIKDFLGVGNIYLGKRQCQLRITKLTDLLNVIIPHFTKYPLLTKQVLKFKLWKRAVLIFKNEQHLTNPGRLLILRLYVSIVNAIPFTFSEHFPNLVPISMPKYNLNISKLNGWWISGYFSINCNFELNVTPRGWNLDYYNCLFHRFTAGRNIRDILIMSAIADYLGANLYIRSNEERIDLQIHSLISASCLVNFFNTYHLESSKHAQFLIFTEFVRLANSYYSLPGMKKAKLGNNVDHFIKLSEQLTKLKYDTENNE